MLQAYTASGQLLLAQNADKKQGPFSCPGCQQEVRLRQGQVMLPHFAHVSKDKCHYFSENESVEHLSLKAALYDVLCRSEKVQVEASLPKIGQIADLLVNDQLALEVQCSSLSQERLRQRTKAYRLHGYQVLWLLGKKLWLKKRLSPLQKQLMYYSENYGFYLWELDLEKEVLRIKYLIHEDLHGGVHYLQETFSFVDLSLSHFRRPFQAQPMPKLTFYEDKQIHTYIQASLARRDKKWLRRQEEAYIRGRNLLQEPLEAFYPQCRPLQSIQGFCQIHRDLSSYYTDFDAYYQNTPYQWPQILYPPVFYAIMKAKKAR